ncbi:MAG: hypothetical protein JNM52_08690 [Betaproteobacteria bacterium]|nr:hypothetical protein [Betaproteobacteria bacterium]
MAAAPSSELSMFHHAPSGRSRSASFDGHFSVQRDSAEVGKLAYHYSASKSTFEVLDIENRKGVPGLGGIMHRHAETFATELEAQRMTTATSQPGFFKKMGYNYTEAQRGINAAKFSPTELATAEAALQVKGAGFLMEKELKRKDSCAIM